MKDNKSYEMNQEQFLGVIKEATDLRHRKMHDYAMSYQTHGSYGIVVRLTDKMQRLFQMTQPGAKPNFESVEDTAIDIINYAAMFIMEGRREKHENVQ